MARSFFQGLLAGDLSVVTPLCAAQVNFDGQPLQGLQPIQDRLQAMVRRAREQGLQLRRVLVLTAAEALQRFGPPPQRVRASLGPQDRVALAVFQRGGAVAILGRSGSFWRVKAITD